MRIGILTFHRANNYGAFLQTFALQSYLQSLGHAVDLIDYWPPAHAHAYDIFYISKEEKGIQRIIAFIRNLLRCGRYSWRRHKMEKLRASYLNLPPRVQYTCGEELRAINYDCVVYGSDQIWWRHSPIAEYNNFDKVYWGEYINNHCRKVAYAASMGDMRLDDTDKQFIKKALNNFSHIAVREQSLKNLLSSLTTQTIYTVLDPTLLLGPSFWKQCANRKVPAEKYVLFYNLIQSPEAESFARAKAKELNCRYIEITGTVRALKLGYEYVQTADAMDFISYVRNAEYVVSTSFHGVAFSIIFEKQFMALGMQNNSGRVASLLEQLGIYDRLNNTTNTGTINYSIVAKRLDALTKEAKNYFSEALK